ncbi:hypothetical protein [Microbacterium oleivorans]|uniref:hypothetical protein n=1 Tax=Microbacterium oleivorans TaxID=273677 RepID=UPI003F53ED9A
MTKTSSNTPRISLPGSVALGTGVMIGAGIFALIGQVAGLAGAWFPLSLLVGGVVAALIILIPFTIVKVRDDPIAVAAAVAIAGVIVIAQTVAVPASA